MKNTLVVARGHRWGGGGFYKRAMPKNPGGDGTILFLECINVNILVVRASNSFARCYHHWVKGRVISVLFPTTAYESEITSNKKSNVFKKYIF